MRCTHAEQVLSTWDPDLSDLPDSVVDHIDACESCREHLDTLWCPAPLPATPVDADARARLLHTVRAERSRRPWVAMLAIAAAFLLAVPVESPSSDPGVMFADVCDPTWPIEDICEV